MLARRKQWEDRWCTNKRNTEALSRNQFWRGKAISVAYSECMFVALLIQHAKRVRRVLLLSVACLVQPYFSTSCHKRHDFRGGKKILNIYYVFWLSLQLLFKHLSFYEEYSEVLLKRYIPLQVKYRYSWQILTNLEFFSAYFRRIVKYQIL